jgi:hypothetical protein
MPVDKWGNIFQTLTILTFSPLCLNISKTIRLVEKVYVASFTSDRHRNTCLKRNVHYCCRVLTKIGMINLNKTPIRLHETLFIGFELLRLETHDKMVAYFCNFTLQMHQKYPNKKCDIPNLFTNCHLHIKFCGGQ